MAKSSFFSGDEGVYEDVTSVADILSEVEADAAAAAASAAAAAASAAAAAASAAEGAGISDGDKGDITVSSSGTVWTVDNTAITYVKIQNVSATDKLLGRSTAGAGSVEEIACTSAGRALIDDVDASAQRTTLGLAIGTDVQAYNANLATLSSGSIGNWKVVYTNGSAAMQTLTVGAAGTALCGNGVTAAPSWQGVCLTTNNLSDVTAATARTNLGLGSIATFPETTDAQYQANTPGKALSTDKVWSAAAPVTLTDGATVTPDFSTGFDFTWTIGATGRTLANPTNIKAGQKGVFYLVQDSGGSKTITSWGTYYKFSGGTKPTLSTAANAVDVLSYVCKSSTEIECFFAGGMS